MRKTQRDDLLNTLFQIPQLFFYMSFNPIIVNLSTVLSRFANKWNLQFIKHASLKTFVISATAIYSLPNQARSNLIVRATCLRAAVARSYRARPSLRLSLFLNGYDFWRRHICKSAAFCHAELRASCACTEHVSFEQAMPRHDLGSNEINVSLLLRSLHRILYKKIVISRLNE